MPQADPVTYLNISHCLLNSLPSNDRADLISHDSNKTGRTNYLIYLLPDYTFNAQTISVNAAGILLHHYCTFPIVPWTVTGVQYRSTSHDF